MLPVSLDCLFLLALRYSLTFIFILCLVLVYPMLAVSLDCLFLLAPSVFSNVYFHPVSCTLCCQFLWIFYFCLPLRYSLTFIFILCLVLVYSMLPVSLDCLFLFAPSVFSNVYFHPMSCSCIPYVARFSRMSIFACPSVFSNVYFHPVSCVPYVASFSSLSTFACPFGIL